MVISIGGVEYSCKHVEMKYVSDKFDCKSSNVNMWMFVIGSKGIKSSDVARIVSILEYAAEARRVLTHGFSWRWFDKWKINDRWSNT